MRGISSPVIVTIGVPVYNGEDYIGRALKSILAQTFHNFEVVISDNASTDTTGEICQNIVKNDNRFSYIRQELNVGANNNFKFLIDNAATDLFVFLAADDYWEPEFLELTVTRLAEEKNAVACISKVDFVKNGVWKAHSDGDFEIRGTVSERLRKYLHNATDNSRFYAVYRRGAIQDSFRDLPYFHSLDWYIVALTLMKGDHLRVDRVLMHRDAPSADKYVKLVKLDNKHFLFGEYFPALPLSFAIFHSMSFHNFCMILRSLLRLNLVMHKHYVICKYPNSVYCKIIVKINRLITHNFCRH